MRRYLTPSSLALVAANLGPVVGVFLLGWDVFPILFVFWLENVVVGGLNALKMTVATPTAPLTWVYKFFLIPFFCVHYGLFCYVHGTLVVAFYGGRLGRFDTLSLTTVRRCIDDYHLGWAVAGLVLSHVFSFAWNYIGQREYQQAELDQLMFQPYGRVIVLHLTVLVGAFVVVALHSPVVGVVCLVGLKTALDVVAHVRERAKFTAPSPVVRLSGAGL